MDAESRPSESEGKLSLELEVPSIPRMVSEVRRAVEKLPLPPPLLDDAQLMVSELVTNSIRHAGLQPRDRIRVRASVSGTKLRVDVFDRARLSRPHRVAGGIRPAPGGQSGWGLYLVDRLATRWGWGRRGYWFELQLEDVQAGGNAP